VASRKIPARLDVFLAPKMRKAIVLRRGPAKQVCTVGWDLSNDTFQLGQWFKGRIHAHCCDLSPDGKYFLYYVLKAKSIPDDWHWTTLSRSPYLKAIGRWKVEGGFHGGGLFVSEDTYWLNNTYGVYSECAELSQELTEPEDEFSRDWRRIYFRRLVRDGWRVEKKINRGTHLDTFTFVKPIDEHKCLKNTIDEAGIGGLGRGMCSSEYQLVNFATGEVELFKDWEWADVDGARLLWAEGGKIFSADVEAQELGPARMLYDFNDMTFQAIEAPY
jgi:hypothetical protein